MIERDLDVFGQTVNLASRIADVAGPGEVLASEAVAEASDDSSFGFERIEDAELKGPSRPGRPLPRHTDRVSDRPYFGLKPAERMVTVKRDPQQVQEWLRQRDLIYGGLIGVGIVMLQPFLTAPSLDLSAKICVVAFSVAIPLLAALVLVNRQESSAVV